MKITGKVSLVYSVAPIIFSSISGYVYAKLTKAFFVYEAPDLWPDELIVFKPRFSFIIMLIGKFLARFAYSVPDIIITVSNLAAEKIREGFRPKVPVYALYGPK